MTALTMAAAEGMLVGAALTATVGYAFWPLLPKGEAAGRWAGRLLAVAVGVAFGLAGTLSVQIGI